MRTTNAFGKLGWLVLSVETMLFAVVVAPKAQRDVRTSSGVVRGYLTPRGYYAYLGVPYARPTRRNRFKAPKPPKSWDGIFEATQRVRCPQPDGTGTEDCLVVNVFTPERATSLPVLVLVHGGSFQSGWGHTRPPTRLLTQDLIIVTLNYRVSVFGFLCLGIPDAPGNAGLKDIVAALYWVHKNIANFGGDPSNVIVYGVASGAAALEFLLLTGSTKGLIHRAILESGSALSPLSLSYDPLAEAIGVAKSLGFEDTESPQDLAIFYNKLPRKAFMNTSNMFLPCIENDLNTTHSLIEKDPREMVKSKSYQMLPMLIAYTNAADEISIEMQFKKLSYLPERFDHILPNNLKFDSDVVKRKVAEVIKKFYLQDEMAREEVLKSFVDYINDVTYEYPIVKSSMMFATTNSMPVYLLKFIIDKSKDSVENGKENPTSILDFFYYNDVLTKAEEYKLSQLTMLWSNFIKMGDPTPITSYLIPVIWQPIHIQSTNLMETEPDIKAVKGMFLHKTSNINYPLADDRIVFWDHIYHTFYRLNIGFKN
ncbi:hypothetical protein evm_005503 [Chilo suppressalis]|nr:hypothetical protein evm_005503 [Chilo suppressalis]